MTPERTEISQTSFERYKQFRQSLVDSEKPWWDKSLTKREKTATEILQKLLEYERTYIFRNLPGEAVPGPDTLDMGGQFLTNKDCIETRSLLFLLAKQVPKGAILHMHGNTGSRPKDLLAKAKSKKNMYIRCNRALREKSDLEEAEVVFSILDHKKVGCKSIFEEDYKPPPGGWAEFEGWMPWREFRKVFGKTFSPNDTKKITRKIADRWVNSKLALCKDEVYGQDQTVNGQVSLISLRRGSHPLTTC